jgi:hypothetical protein
MARRWSVLSLILLVTGALGGTASAQVLGIFRWQLAPHCNVLTMTVEQRETTYRLDGTDDLCGAPVHAAASGTAHVNPNGSVSIAVTVTRPDGIPIQHNLSLTLPSLSGTWTDEGGNEGVLIFAPAVPALGAPKRVTLRGTYAVDYVAGLTGASAISFGRQLPSPPIPHLVTSSTAECPGSSASPEAAPGHLCVYTASSLSAVACIVSAAFGPCGTTSRTGAVVWVQAAFTGRVYHVGTWAVTLP